MAKRIIKRSEWRRTKSGAWTCSIGDRGTRVRLFEKRSGQGFYRGVWTGKREDRKPLHTTDKAEAMRLGRALLAELLAGDAQLSNGAAARQPLTLGRLWRRYSTECAEFLDNKNTTREDAASIARMLLAFFGEDFRVEDFTKNRQRLYEAARQAGGIRYTDSRGRERVSRPTRARSAEQDVTLLHTMLSFAVSEKLLQAHPLYRVKRVRELNPKRPVATWERYQATVAAMRELRSEDAVTWARMEFALFLAEQTGRRLGSIAQLHWEDFWHERALVFWRAEADKKGYQWEVPMPAEFFESVKRFQRDIGGIGGYVFASEDVQGGAWDRDSFDHRLRIAEEKAKLPKLDRGLWHPYRRKWAIERKRHALKDVAAAGGWKGIQTLATVYQQSDAESVLAVTSEPLKLRERGVA